MINHVRPSFRIGYVIDNLSRAGTQKTLVNLVCGLAEQGYEQRIYCLNKVFQEDIVQSLAKCKSTVLIIGKNNLVLLWGLKKLYDEFRTWRPQIVQTFLPFSDIIGRTIAHFTGVPVIVSSIRCRNIEKQWWQFLLDRLTMRWADKVVFNSKNVISFALKKEGVYREQIVYIPNGIKSNENNIPSTRSKIHSELGISPITKLIGIVGRLHPQKGHVHLLQAYKEVIKKKPNTSLLIIGDGPLRNKLELEVKRLNISERVFFLGERSDIFDLLACLDVYVQASLYEGMPNAVMEAMRAGKAVVATDIDGTGELITDGKTGWLTKPSDTKAMANKILYALKNPSVSNSIGKAAIEHIAEHFTVDKMVSNYNSLYKQLLKKADILTL